MSAYRPLFLFFRLAALICIMGCAFLSLPSCAPKSDAPPNVDTESEYTGKIFFENRRYTFEGDKHCIATEDDALVINKEGTYLLSGILSEGRIVTDAPFVRLVLANVEITSSVSSPIESRSGTLVLESETDSVNLIRADCPSDGKTQGVIHTGGDLFLFGGGRITVSTQGLPYALTCHRFYTDSGELSITAEGGIYTSEARIGGGRLTISGAKTGIYATVLIEMTGGALVALCEEAVLLAEDRLVLAGGERDVSAKTPYVCKKDEKTEK